MKRFATVRFWHRAAVGLLLINLLPLFVISLYARMCADDYAYAILVRKAIKGGHGPGGYFAALARQVLHSYKTWQGSYAAAFFSTLVPGAFHPKAYALTGICMTGLLVLSVFVLFRSISYGAQARMPADIAAAVTSLLIIEFMPRALDAFFWWNGAANYTVFFILEMLEAAVFIQLLRSGSCSNLLIVLCCILAFLISGGNYVPSLVGAECALLCLIMYAVRFRKFPTRLFLVNIFSLSGLALSIFSPGNAVRMATDMHTQAATTPQALLALIFRCLQLAAGAIQGSVQLFLILGLVFLLPFLWLLSETPEPPAAAQASGAKVPVVLAAGTAFLLYASSFAPTVFVDGTEGPVRTMNYRHMLLIVLLVLLEAHIVRRVRCLLQNAMGEKLQSLEHAALMDAPGYFGSIVLIFAVCCLYYIVPTQNRTIIPSIAAARSVLIGEAPAYAEEMDERESVLTAAGEGADVVVTLPQDRPGLLYSISLDITQDENGWLDKSVAEYYGLHTVQASEQ